MHTALPPVDDLMREIRSGLEDISISEATATKLESTRSIQTDLRQAAATASVLGRCGGSLRGRLFQALAPLALPIIEQLNLFHQAMLSAAGKLHDHAAESNLSESRLNELETRIAALEKQGKPGACDGETR